MYFLRKQHVSRSFSSRRDQRFESKGKSVGPSKDFRRSMWEIIKYKFQMLKCNYGWGNLFKTRWDRNEDRRCIHSYSLTLQVYLLRGYDGLSWRLTLNLPKSQLETHRYSFQDKDWLSCIGVNWSRSLFSLLLWLLFFEFFMNIFMFWRHDSCERASPTVREECK